MDSGWLTLPLGITKADGKRARRHKRRAREVSILAWGTYREKVKELQARIRFAVRRGHVRKSVRLVEELRQMVKARKVARRALRAAQMELFQRVKVAAPFAPACELDPADPCGTCPSCRYRRKGPDAPL